MRHLDRPLDTRERRAETGRRYQIAARAWIVAKRLCCRFVGGGPAASAVTFTAARQRPAARVKKHRAEREQTVRPVEEQGAWPRTSAPDPSIEGERASRGAQLAASEIGLIDLAGIDMGLARPPAHQSARRSSPGCRPGEAGSAGSRRGVDRWARRKGRTSRADHPAPAFGQKRRQPALVGVARFVGEKPRR